MHCKHDPHCKALVDKQFEGYSTLQWMEAGAIELFYEEEHYDLRSDSKTTWFWPAYPGPHIRFHLAREEREWNHRYAAFTGPLLESWKRTGLWLTKPQMGPRGQGHRFQMDELIALINRGGTWGLRRAAHTLEGLLLELAEARAASQIEALWLEQSRQFLANNRDFNPNYAVLARELGMGLSTLRRHFKEATGLSLHEALLQNRLDSARQLLGETDLPLKQVAAQLGYRDVYFFSNQFKKLSGVSPAAYRRSRQM